MISGTVLAITALNTTRRGSGSDPFALPEFIYFGGTLAVRLQPTVQHRAQFFETGSLAGERTQ